MRSLSVRQTLLIANFQAAFFKVVRFSRATLKNVSISSPFERSTVLSDTCQTGAEGSSLPETRDHSADNKTDGSSGGQAAVKGQDRAGDELRLVGGEIDGQ